VYTRIVESDLIPGDQRGEMLKRALPALMDSEAQPIDETAAPRICLTSQSSGGPVDRELLLPNEYLVTENHTLRGQITGHVPGAGGPGAPRDSRPCRAGDRAG
jgi:hypothetical protein